MTPPNDNKTPSGAYTKTVRLSTPFHARYFFDMQRIRDDLLECFEGVTYERHEKDDCLIVVTGRNERTVQECAKEIYDTAFELVVRELRHAVEPGSQLDQHMQENNIWTASNANGPGFVLVPPLKLGAFEKDYGDHIVPEQQDEMDTDED